MRPYRLIFYFFKRYLDRVQYRLAIMPSKYTDEIENSSYTWRAFSMTRKAKFSVEEKLAILNELSHSSAKEVTRKHSIGKGTISRWRLLYKYQGIDGLRSSH